MNTRDITTGIKINKRHECCSGREQLKNCICLFIFRIIQSADIFLYRNKSLQSSNQVS